MARRLYEIQESDYRRITGGRSLGDRLRATESLMASGRLAQAEAAFRKYVELQPWSGDGLAALGTLLVQQGREPEALEPLRQALKLDPDQPDVRKTLAQGFVVAGQYADAIGELERMPVVQGRNDPELYVLLARSHLLLGDENKATAAINRGGRAFPDSPEFLRGVAALVFELNPEGAITAEMMRQLVTRFPRDAAGQTLFADWAYKKQGAGGVPPRIGSRGQPPSR